MRLTDKAAIRLALEAAIEWERSVIDAYRDEFTREPNEDELAVINARRKIKAWRRVLGRYYRDPRTAQDKYVEWAAEAPTVNIMDLMRRKPEDD